MLDIDIALILCICCIHYLDRFEDENYTYMPRFRLPIIVILCGLEFVLIGRL